jgi:Na+/H+ antiporter NhaD/arsenite permease-like protein
MIDWLADGANAIAAAGDLDGTRLGLLWGIPFAGLLLSIAFMPVLAPHVWEHHFGKIAVFWALALLVPAAAIFGAAPAVHALLHTLLLEYIPFILIAFALFVVAGGIRITGNFVGTPGTNTAMLAAGTLSASFVGTTGASMVLIRPMIRANEHRRHKVHVFVFFIFLVSNIGGALTPLGDPPLFLGFLKGVDFLWTFEAMLLPMLFMSVPLLALFYALDRVAWAREAPELRSAKRERAPIRIEGAHNLFYLLVIALTVLASGIWNRDATLPTGFGFDIPVNGLLRDFVLIWIAVVSWMTTRQSVRVENAFTWAPMQEVAVLFLGIFITMIPMLAMLKAGTEGPFAPLLALVTTPDGKPIDAAYFWLTGMLSSFLDNAPTYLVFFNLAGGDAQALMGPLASTLLAISAGAVFMGANTYIGNAPNFMVYAIAKDKGVNMPSFFGYMAWSGLVLIPVFVVSSLIFFG